MKTSERARIPRTVPAILAVLILIAAAAAGNAAAQTGPPAPMNPAASLALPEITDHTVSRPGGRRFDSPGQARAHTDESALPGSPYTNTAPAHEEPQGICDRNQAVQDSVLAKLPSISQCSSVTGEHLRGLSGPLDISGQSITALSAADFQGMSGITGIDASENQLSHVPGDLLQQLRHQSHTHSTTETSRNGYVIAVIDKSGSMSGQLSTAKSGARWLAANRPTDMPMAVMAFSDTARTAQDFTTETGLLNNAINSLSSQGGTNMDGALAGAYSQAGSRPDTSLPVAIIVFSDGGFTLSGSLHDTMSTNAANGVRVSAISTSGDNANMQGLAARGGGVYNTQPSSSQSGSYFPAETTSETTTTTTGHEPSITSIDLSGNSLSSLPGGTFAQLPTLTSINLRGNSLTSVPPGLPAGLTALDLSDNSIGSLPDGIFNGLTQLATLKMAGNPGAPFRFVIELTQNGLTTIAATLSQDAPFPVSAALAAEHAVLDRTAVSIARAGKDGGIVTVQPDVDHATAVRVRVASAEFSSGATSGIAAVPGPALTPVFPQVLTMAAKAKESAEGMTATITVSADHAAEHDTTARYTVITDEDQATPDAGPADYADQGNGAVTIPAGETTADIVIDIHDDDDAGDAHGEMFAVSLTPSGGDAYWVGAQSRTLVKIRTGICDRTQAVQDGLMAQLPGRANCGQVTQGDLQGITGGVTVRDQELTGLMAHDFKDLTRMSELAINANLPSLPPGIFDGLSGLTALDLAGNAFTTVPGELPAALTSIDLSSNQIGELPDGALSRYAALRSLDLRDNPGSPFLYTVNVRQAQDDFRAVIVRADRPMPFQTGVTLSATAASLSKTRFEVAREAQDGGATVVTPDDWNSTGEIRLRVTEASFRNGENLRGIEPAAGPEIVVQFPIIISLSADTASASQGDTITIVATAAPTPAEDLTVRYVFGTGDSVTSDGTATGRIDRDSYTDLNDGQVTIPANTSTGQFQIRIDQADEEPKNLYVMVNNHISITNDEYMGHPDTGTVRIIVRQDSEEAGSNPQPEPEPADPPAAPEAPAGTVNDPGSGSIDLDWNDVALATGYQVALWEHPDLVPLPSEDHPEVQVVYSGSSAAVTGLPTEWSHYWFKVRASNSAGSSDWSGWSSTANQ